MKTTTIALALPEEWFNLVKAPNGRAQVVAGLAAYALRREMPSVAFADAIGVTFAALPSRIGSNAAATRFAAADRVWRGLAVRGAPHLQHRLTERRSLRHGAARLSGCRLAVRVVE